MRKTIKITNLLSMVNHRNFFSTCSPEHRAGWNSLLEQILNQTDTYAGFRSLNHNEVPESEKPGIVQSPNGHPPTFPDETRVRYFTHYKLNSSD